MRGYSIARPFSCFRELVVLFVYDYLREKRKDGRKKKMPFFWQAPRLSIHVEISLAYARFVFIASFLPSDNVQECLEGVVTVRASRGSI